MRLRLLSSLILATLALVAVAGCGGGSDGPPAAERNDLGQRADRFTASDPNILVVTTDDQSLDTMRAMSGTKRVLGRSGVDFRNSFSSFPLCCPSRATFLTGQYAHNHGVLDNGPPVGGISALDQDSTLPVWLREDGYETTFVGKYLNGYGKKKNGGSTFIPPGWVNWRSLTSDGKTSAYDYDVNDNGELVSYGREPGDYKTTVTSDLAAGALEGQVASERPFFMWIATSAPHTDGALGPRAPRNPIPAPGDRGSYKDAKLPRPPSFDEADVSDKPPLVSGRERLTKDDLAGMRTTYVSQLESLRAVDRMLLRLVKILRDADELENTIVVFTSDNGFLRGQHRFDSGKSLIYEGSIRVPLLVAGPGFSSGRSEDALVSNVDLAATFVRASGARPDRRLDGVPLQDKPLAKAGREDVLLEIFGRRNGNVFGLRTPRYVYVEHETGFTELYDLDRDPGQLRNVEGTKRLAGIERKLAGRLADLRECSGRSCGQSAAP